MKAFNIHFGEEQMEELRRRIDCTRLPKPLNDGAWALGTDGDYKVAWMGMLCLIPLLQSLMRFDLKSWFSRVVMLLEKSPV